MFHLSRRHASFLRIALTVAVTLVVSGVAPDLADWILDSRL